MTTRKTVPHARICVEYSSFAVSNWPFPNRKSSVESVGQNLCLTHQSPFLQSVIFLFSKLTRFVHIHILFHFGDFARKSRCTEKSKKVCENMKVYPQPPCSNQTKCIEHRKRFTLVFCVMKKSPGSTSPKRHAKFFLYPMLNQLVDSIVTQKSWLNELDEQGGKIIVLRETILKGRYHSLL